MNKCYQVIWSTVKQAYIVVSELAGQRTKGYTTTVQGARVVLAALVAASVIGSAQGETPYDFKLTKHVEMEKDSSVSDGEFFVDVNIGREGNNDMIQSIMITERNYNKTVTNADGTKTPVPIQKRDARLVYVDGNGKVRTGSDRASVLYVDSQNKVQTGNSNVKMIYLDKDNKIQTGTNDVKMVYVDKNNNLQTGTNNVKLVYVDKNNKVQTNNSNVSMLYMNKDNDIVAGEGASVTYDYNAAYHSKLSNIAVGKNAKTITHDGTAEAVLSFGEQIGEKFDGLTIKDNREALQNLPEAIAIGTNTYARTGSIVIGARTLDKNKIAIGGTTADKLLKPELAAMTNIGTNSYTYGTFATTLGSYNVQSSPFTGASGLAGISDKLNNGFRNTFATVVGSMNSNESMESGNRTSQSGVANVITGSVNRVVNSNGAIVIGSGNQVKESLAELSGLNVQAASKGFDSVQAMQAQMIEGVKESTGGSTLVIGGANKAEYTLSSKLVGVRNTLTGTSKNKSQYDYIDGYENTVTSAKNVTLTGTQNTVDNTNSAILFGDMRKLNRADRTVVMGAAKESKDDPVLTTATDAVIVGYNANVMKNGGAALGSNSVAATDKGTVGYDMLTGTTHIIGENDADGYAWTSTAAAVSVGDTTATKNVPIGSDTINGLATVAVDDANTTIKTEPDTSKYILRQITGVAAGSELTDAVNVAQLKLLASNVVAGQTHYYSVKNDGVNVRNEAVEINPSIITGDSSNYNNDGAKGFGSIVSGIGSQIQVGQPSGDAYKVGNSYDSTIGNQFFMQGFGAAASGLLNTIDATGKHPFDGFGNTLNGVGNTTVNASGVSTMGDANFVTNTNNYQGNDGMYGLTKLDGITLKMSEALKKGDLDAFKKAVAEAAKTTGNVAVLGNNNSADMVNNVTITGANNKLSNDSGIIKEHIYITGNQNTSKNSESSIISGNDNSISDGRRTSVVGSGNSIEGAKDSDSDDITEKSDSVHVVGDSNQISGSESIGILGQYNMVVNGYYPDGDRQVANSSESVYVLGEDNYLADVQAVTAVGSENSVNSAWGVSVTGDGNSIKSTKQEVPADNPYFDDRFGAGSQSVQVSGFNNEITDSYLTGVSGSNNVLDKAIDSTILGNNNAITGTLDEPVKDAVLLGNNRALTNVMNTVVIGGYTPTDSTASKQMTTTANNATILGQNANVIVEGGVSLGYGSLANTESGIQGYDPATGTSMAKSEDDLKTATWTATAAAVAVGDTSSSNPAEWKTRQITGVAAGKADTDAVNMAQLRQVVNLTKGTGEGAIGGFALIGNTKNSDNTAHIVRQDLGAAITVKGGMTDERITNAGGLDKAITNVNTYVTANNGDKTLIVGMAKDVIDLNSVTTNKKDAATGITSEAKLAGDAVQVTTTNKNGSKQDTQIKGNDVVVQSIDAMGNTQKAQITGNEVTLATVDKNGVLTGVETTVAHTGIIITPLDAQDSNMSATEKEKKVVSVTEKGLSNGNNQIHYVSSGLVDRDGKTIDIHRIERNQDGSPKLDDTVLTNVVNVGDLFTAVNNASTTVTTIAKTTVTGDNTMGSKGAAIVTESTADDGHSIFNVHVDKVIEVTPVDGHTEVQRGPDGKYYTAGSIKDAVYVNGHWYNAQDVVEGQPKDTAVIITPKLADIKNSVVNPNASTGSTNEAIVLDNVKSGIGGVVGNGASKANSEKGYDIGDIGKGNNTFIDNVTKIDGIGPDAINKDTVATAEDIKNLANSPLFFSADSKEENTGHNTFGRKIGDELRIVGGEKKVDALSDNNIGVVSNGSDTLTVKLAKDLKELHSVTTIAADGGTSKMTGDGIVTEIKDASTGAIYHTELSPNGMKITAGINDIIDRTVTLTADGLDNGGNKITHVADGTVSPTSTDAVNGSQLFRTNIAVNKLSQRINRAGANAAALAALHPLDFDPDDKWDITAGYGNYRNANAVSIGAFYRPNEDTMFSIGTSLGGGENMINAGITVKLGQGNHVSISRVAMAKEIRDLRDIVSKQASDMAQMKQLLQIPLRTGEKNILFPDVARNHWAYEYVKKIADNGIIEGYPDGLFKGDSMMTRYEFAAIVYRLMQQGIGHTDGEMERLVDEFAPELQYIRIDTIHKDKNGEPTVQRVRVTEYRRTHA